MVVTLKVFIMVKGFVVMVNFMVVNMPAHYNFILDRPWIHKTRAVHFTYHQSIKYLKEEAIMKIQGD